MIQFLLNNQLVSEDTLDPNLTVLNSRNRRIQHHKVRFFTDVEISDDVVEIQRTRPAQRGVIEGFGRAEPVVLQLAHLVGFAQGLQHIKGGACTDIGAYPHFHALLPAALNVKQAAAEKQV